MGLMRGLYGGLYGGLSNISACTQFIAILAASGARLQRCTALSAAQVCIYIYACVSVCAYAYTRVCLSAGAGTHGIIII
jgi:hypothetical protein